MAGCASEPIHAPGAVQPHGALLALQPNGTVVVASENCNQILGLDASTILGRRFADLVDADTTASVVSAEAGDLVEVEFPSGGCEAVVHRGPPFDLVEIEPTPSEVIDDQARLHRTLLRFHGATTSAGLVDQAAAIVADLTGFDRVMVYRFDPEWNGEVVAEVIRPGYEPFLGLHYPASDIPPQARALYSRERLRLIADATAEPSPLLAQDRATAAALDLSEVSLRAVSPVHLQYLANMGVRSSMSVAIHVHGRLWGLLACHHVSRQLYPSIRTRHAVDLVGRTTSTILAALLAAESGAISALLLGRLEAVTNSVMLKVAPDPAEALADEGERLAALLDAGGAAIVDGRRTYSFGACPPVEMVDALVAHVGATRTTVFQSVELALIHDDWTGHADTAAGAVIVRIGSAERWLAWFRPQTAGHVRWGGDPWAKVAAVGQGGQVHLNPRASFAEYLEQVQGVCVPWTKEQVAIASTAAARVADLYALKLQRDASIAATVQRAVMLETIPPIPGVDAAAHYQPDAGHPLGGDWYDVFFRHRGEAVVALGDVAGHGIDAAGTMAQLRHAMRAYLLREDTSAEAMSRLNDLMYSLLPGDMATAVVASLDPVAHTAEIIRAGHLPPVVVGPHGARLVEEHPNLAFGVQRDVRYTSTVVHLPADNTLILYTDGLIERRHHTLDEALEALLDVAATTLGLGAADVCDHLLAGLTRTSRIDDDVTIVAMSFLPDTNPSASSPELKQDALDSP